MRIGEIIQIRGCEQVPEVIGQRAEVTELQMQDYERYRVYPIWAKLTTGPHAGKVYGFQEVEVETVTKASEAQTARGTRRVKAVGATVAEQVEEILKGVATVDEISEIEKIVEEVGKISVGDVVQIKACEPIPELIGEKAEVVELQIQEHEKYRLYPIWVKVTTGKRADKIYGLQEAEVELISKKGEGKKISGTRRVEAIGTKVAEQLEEILKGVATVEEIAEIDKVIAEAKGKIMAEPGLGFWEGKTPCWEMFRCPEAIKAECPAFKFRSLPCWEIEGTYCKLFDYGTKGDGTDVCQHCRAYKRWGQAKPIELKLLGRGFNRVGR